MQAKSETPTLCTVAKNQPFTSVLSNLYAPDTILVSRQCDKTEVSAWEDCTDTLGKDGWLSYPHLV